MMAPKDSQISRHRSAWPLLATRLVCSTLRGMKRRISMNDPLVSVIIPAYKQADYLGAAIRSVLDQSYTSIEALVVDDVSPDHTADVVRSFDDPRLHYILHDRNRMLAAARNTGMRAARGEIFALLDAD